MNKGNLPAFFVIFLIVLDRITKGFFLKNHSFFENNLLKLAFSQNPNLFFWPVSQKLLIFFSLIILGGLFLFVVKRKQKSNPLLTFALMLIIFGGLSNLSDRIIFGYVIDFIWVFFLPISFFNIADTMITIGCLLTVVSFTAQKKI